MTQGGDFMASKKKVYSFGILTPSELYRTDGEFPRENGYAELIDSFMMTGGEACNTSIVLSKLDVDVTLDGLWLGDNPKAQKMLSVLNSYRIDTTLLTIKSDYKNVEEIVIASGDSRTIFASYSKLFQGKRLWNNPHIEAILDADMVCIDPFLGVESTQAAAVCVKHNKPYVTVDCEFDSYIAENAACNILSSEFLDRVYPNTDRTSLMNNYQQYANGIVVFTSGKKNILYSSTSETNEFTPYTVEALDTTGAGDSFRAGMMYGLLQNYPIKKCIAFASVLAAYICQSFPGVLHAPTMDELVQFARKNKFPILE